MSTTTSSPKKPPSTTTSSTSSDRRPPSTNSNRSPSRMAAQTAQTTSTPTTVNRVRSTRNGVNGTPVSARAAARKPAGSVGDATLEDGAEDAKLELQAKLAELQEKLKESELAHEESRKYAEVLQIKLDEAGREQSLLEENYQGQVEKIEELESERRESTRARREFEQIYEAERAQAMREKEEGEVEREAMAANMQRLKETLASRELRASVGGDDERRHSMSRTSSLRSEDRSPNPDSRAGRERGSVGGGFAPAQSSTSLQRSDSRSSSRLVLQKDKVIESLRLELAEAQIKLVELENKGGSSMQQFERQMYDIKMSNARLMEENESFQLLLSEKTLNGDLAQSELLRPPSHQGDTSRPSSRPPAGNRKSLGDELEDQDESIDNPDSAGGEGSTERRLQAEVNSLKDQNKALTLYINNIISRLLQHEQFEAILDKTPDLMAGPGAASRKYAERASAPDALSEEKTVGSLSPPQQPKEPAVQEAQPTGLLQRAGSVLRRKPRPVSQLPPATNTPEQPRIEEPTVHENPDTAPSIPLSQTSSRSSAAPSHRRSRSDWGTAAASVVGNMYKGPAANGGLGTPGALSPGLTSPGLTPGLTSAPPNRTSFFPTPQQMLEDEARENALERDKENLNQQQRDSKLGAAASPERIPTRNSNRNSVISSTGPLDPSYDPNDPLNSNSNSNPSSPPRSITSSSGEYRDPRGPSGAIMMGSKPRPLRLVQEADEERERKKGQRASWWGGTFGGLLQGKGAEGTPGQ